MADAETSLEIVARLRDEASPGFEKLEAQIREFAKLAPVGSALLTKGAEELATASLAASARIKEAADVARVAVNQQRDALKGGQTGAAQGEAKSLADTLLGVERSSEAARAKLAAIGPVLEQNRAAASQLFALVDPGFKNVNAQVDHLVRQLERAAQIQPQAGAAIDNRLGATQAAITQARGGALPVQLAGAARAPILGLGDRDTFITDQTRKLRTEVDALAKSSADARTQLVGLGAGGREGAGGLAILNAELGSVTLGAAGGFGLATGAVLAFVGAVRAAAEESAKIDKALAPIAAQSKEAAASIGIVRQNVRDLRAETGRSIDDVAGLAAATSEFGKQADQEFQRVVLRASDAGFGGAQQTLQRLRQIAQGFGEELNTENFERIGDTVKSVSDLVGVSAEKVADATAGAAAAADDYDISLSALSVTVGNATRRTGDQAQAATQARQAMKLLADDTSELNNVLEAHGVRVDRAALAGEGFARVSAEVARVLREQPSLRSELPDRLATFFESQTDALAQTAAASAGAAGSLRAASERFQDTADQQATRASERFNELKSSVIDALVPVSELKVQIGALFNDLQGGKAIELPPLLKLLTVPGLVSDLLAKTNQLRELAKLEGGESALGRIGEKLETVLGPATFLVDLLGKANDKIKEADSNLADRVEELRRIAALGATGGGDPAERPGATEGARFAEDFNSAVDTRIDFVSDAAIDRGQQRIAALLDRLSALKIELPIPLAPVLEPEAISFARAQLDALRRIRDDDLTGDEKAQIESLSETVKTYADALKDASEIADRASGQVTDGFTRQRKAIEDTRAETVRLLESFRSVVPVDGVIALVNQGAAAETKKVDQQELARFASSANARAQANAAELQAVSRLAKLRGDLAQSERDEIEALRQKGDVERGQIEAARTAAIEKAAGSRQLIADANAEADAKLRTLGLEERAAALERERARERRNIQAEEQLQALRDDSLVGLEAELAAIRRTHGERARSLEFEARTNAELRQRLPLLLEANQASSDAQQGDARREARLRVNEELLFLERSTVTSLERQFELDLKLLELDQKRARIALRADGASQQDQFQQADIQFLQLDAERARQELEKRFGRGAGIDIFLRPRIEIDRAEQTAKLEQDLIPLRAQLERSLADIRLNIDVKQNEENVDRLARKIRELQLASRLDFGTALGNRLLDNFDELADPELNGIKLADSLVGDLHDSVRSLLDDLVNGKASVRDFFEEFARSIQSSLLDSVTDQLVGQLGLGFGSLFGGAPAGGSGGIFERGGIMTKDGPVPLRQYAGGGIANSPQLALFGEGSVPEAYVPVPSGRIPVEIRGGERRESGARVIREQPIVVHVSLGGIHQQINATDPQTFSDQLAIHMDDIADGIAAKVESASHSGVRSAIRRVPRS